MLVTAWAGAVEESVPSVQVPTSQTLTAEPQEVDLVGQRAKQYLLVTGRQDDGTEADFSRLAEYASADSSVATVTSAGVVLPRGNGVTTITVRYGELTADVAVRVRHLDRSDPIDFRTEVIGALSRGGCNQGACHGSPQGKNGFRLSLRGFDPDLDLKTLAREALGRRTNVSFPDQSLMLQKPLGRVSHEGGVRFKKSDSEYQVLRHWIAEGLRDSVERRVLDRLEILPGGRYLHSASPEQRVVTRAHFDDGSVRDVTELTVFSSSDEETATVSENGLVRFLRTGEVAILVRYLHVITSIRLSYVRTDPSFVFVAPPERNFIDRHVFAKQKELQIRPVPLASDEVFLRRVYLDAIGTLPSASEAREFLDSDDPDRRAKLVDRILERREFAYFWAMKWADVMRGNRITITKRGVNSLHRYLVKQFTDDRPFDRFAHEVLTSTGNTLHRPAANFYRIAREPNAAAESMSQLFLGVRIQCAQCHNHPYEPITQADYYGLSAFFSRVRRKSYGFGRDDEVIYLATEGEVQNPATGQPQPPAAFGVGPEKVGPKDDLRAYLAEWLTSAKNRYFARSTVNRVWSHLLGRGIVEPVDDFRESNPPSNPELLDALAAEFVREGYRFKSLIRAILNSSTYQLSAEPGVGAAASDADAEKYFSRALVRRYNAEQIIDAIAVATGVPERFPGYPLGVRAIELPEGDVNHHFLKAFSRPMRDVACDCARETEPSLKEVVHLLNNPEILDKFTAPKSRLSRWRKKGKSFDDTVELIYLSFLARRPADSELQIARQHASEVGDEVDALRDLQHAIINANEFLLRH